MRLLVLLLALLLGGGLWWLLSGSGGSADGPRRPDPAEEELARTENLHFTRGSEVLTLWVKGPDSKAPLGAEVGIRHQGRTRWLYTDERGRRVFTDAPVGALEVLARAPGYDEATQQLTIEAGVPAETIVMIRPSSTTAPTR